MRPVRACSQVRFRAYRPVLTTWVSCSSSGTMAAVRQPCRNIRSCNTGLHVFTCTEVTMLQSQSTVSTEDKPSFPQNISNHMVDQVSNRLIISLHMQLTCAICHLYGQNKSTMLPLKLVDLLHALQTEWSVTSGHFRCSANSVRKTKTNNNFWATEMASCATHA